MEELGGSCFGGRELPEGLSTTSMESLHAIEPRIMVEEEKEAVESGRVEG